MRRHSLFWGCAVRLALKSELHPLGTIVLCQIHIKQTALVLLLDEKYDHFRLSEEGGVCSVVRWSRVFYAHNAA